MTFKTAQDSYGSLLTHYSSCAPAYGPITPDDIELDGEDLGRIVAAHGNTFFMESICDSGATKLEPLDKLFNEFVVNKSNDLTPSAQFLEKLGKIVFDGVELYAKKQLIRDIECDQAERYSQ